MTNRRTFLKQTAALTAAAGAMSVTGVLSGCSSDQKVNSAADLKKSKKPNIVFFFSDQHRRQALSLWNKPEYKGTINGIADPVHTPHLDALAKEGVTLTQCISSTPVCSPARGMLLSGQYPHKNGVPWNCRADRPWGLHQDTESLAVVLGKNGYSCGYIGKWHLEKPLPNDPANPGNYVAASSPDWVRPLHLSMDSYTEPQDRQGFDFWYAYGTYDNHAEPHYYDTDGNRHEPGIWATLHETDVAISYLKNEKGQREDGQPFLLFLSTHPPHNQYTQLRDTDPEMFHAYYSPEKIGDIEALLNRPNREDAKLPMKMVYSSPEDQYVGIGLGTAEEVVRYYFSSISGVDRQLGRLMEALEASGEADNTIVVYSSDHGEMLGSHGLMAKSTIYEESIGIPMIIRYPDRLKPAINDVLMGSMDVMPTLLGLAGLEDDIPAAVDGLDLSRQLDGTADPADKPSSSLYMLHVEQKGLRTDRYSFAINRDGEGVLFDNINDPYQQTNIFDRESDVVKQLGAELGQKLRVAGDLWYLKRINDDVIQYS